MNGKHTVRNIGSTYVLEIAEAQESDEENYTINMRNSSGTSSCSAFVRVRK